MNGKERVIIENVTPQINRGEFPAKRVVDDLVKVEADIFSDGHDLIRARLHFKGPSEQEWQHVEMTPQVNDRWSGSFRITQPGMYTFTLSAWVDHFGTWYRDIQKKMNAGTDEKGDLLVGAELINAVLDADQSLSSSEREELTGYIQLLSEPGERPEERLGQLTGGHLPEMMHQRPLYRNMTRFADELPVLAERQRANFSSWYELFPRSLGREPGKHGTFRDCIEHLPYVADMGFDVLYLPPIHPIGRINRKGKNNSTISRPGEPGSPWAIGSEEGGHTSIHHELGTPEEFRALIKKAGESGIEIAMDMAFQCAPDHPWVKEHPDWFRMRPDGTLQYAENPPKKYEDIYPLHFESEDWKNLWEELKKVFLYWIDQGVTIFRVDNPHTKSLRFWGWVIAEIRKQHPGVIFLSEAFTRPKVMYQLAKRGFSQSYTYFTWRNTKYELTTYLEELIQSGAREFFRPDFWPNTPDILPEFLQVANRAGYIQRLFLAATLSSNYGIYGPAFELMERTPLEPGREEYMDSEKYEIKQWDLDRSGSLRKIIARINRIRKENKALQNTHSLKFHPIDNEALLCYSKTSEDLDNMVLMVVNLDPHHTHSGWISLPLDELGLDPYIPFQVHDLISGSYYLWNGSHNYVEVDPGVMPAHLFRIRRKVRSERDFDYFM